MSITVGIKVVHAFSKSLLIAGDIFPVLHGVPHAISPRLMSYGKWPVVLVVCSGLWKETSSHPTPSPLPFIVL